MKNSAGATWLFIFLVLMNLALPINAQSLSTAYTAPHLTRRGEITQLLVDGNPYLILGGEVHNSSSSSLDYMRTIWPQMQAMNLNTLLLPVAWETIEPEEGKFDFTLVDGLLTNARQHNMHLILLWFGAWKNTYSTYVPGWVKRDTDRFLRVKTRDGADMERLSPFSTEVRDADAKAFSALMNHLREKDGVDHTVLMIQVENEVGISPDSRDRSAQADAAFRSPVPTSLTHFLVEHRATLDPGLRTVWESAGGKTAGTWQDVFGTTPITDDLFMAWHFANYIQYVAAAGKAKYFLPMFVNAALIRPNYGPGEYNSGGPLPQSIDIWHSAAPAIDLICPDIYLDNFSSWANRYSRPDNPLFIPETRGGAMGAADALYAFGRYSAIGFSPFGIDNPADAPADLAGIASATEKSDNQAVANTYSELSHLAPLILQKQVSGDVSSGILEVEAQHVTKIDLRDYTATMVRSGGKQETRVAVMFIRTAPSEFLVIGSGDAQLSFSAKTAGPPMVGIESIDEEFYKNGTWKRGRRINGDENSHGKYLSLHARDPADGRIYRLRLYRYR